MSRGLGWWFDHGVTVAGDGRAPDNAPLLITQRITHTTDGRPLALEETRLSGDDTQLTYTLTAITQDISTDRAALS